jgi:hypothetical protein
MAVIACRLKSTLLKNLSRSFAYILGLFGVISGSCGFAPDYGVPSVLCISGTVRTGPVSIPGIQVEATGTDTSVVYTSDITGEYGLYYLYIDFPWPDSIRVAATDIDGELNGSLLPGDTLLTSIPDEEYPELTEVDFSLLPDEE